MNRNLLIFSIIMILAGLTISPYILLIGLFLLFPALLVPSNPPPQRPPPSQGQQPVRRHAPQPAPTYEPSSAPALQTAQAPQQMVPAAPIPTTQISGMSYSPPLFPTSMFPSSSQSTPMSMFPSTTLFSSTGQLQRETPGPQAARGAHAESREPKDELLELGALLALLKLAFG